MSETFIFAGTKGGAGRTVSSILFAAGLQRLGVECVHVQVLASGRPAVLKGVKDIPFRTFSVPEGISSLHDGVLSVLHGTREANPIVVDLPSGGIRQLVEPTKEARILLPMRTEAEEIQTVAADYLDTLTRFSSASGGGPPRIWLLPIGWPRGLRCEDYRDILRRRGLPAEVADACQVIIPGVPTLDHLDLALALGDDRFALDESLQDAAESLARSVLSAIAK